MSRGSLAQDDGAEGFVIRHSNFVINLLDWGGLNKRLAMVLLAIHVILMGVVSVADARVPNDTFYPQQWYLRQINAEAAWNKTTGSDRVVVAVIDTGVDVDHEDLRENIWMNTGEIPGNGIDDDKNGYVDDVHGWNFLAKTNDVRPKESGSTEEGFVHGTLVASLIGARGDNGIGVAGVAWRVKIMPIVALDETGGGSSDDVADAVRYAVANGAHVINLSLEGYTNSTELAAALAYARSKGVLTVAASGNAEDPTGIDLDVLRVYPACMSLDSSFGVIAVGGTDTLDQKALYSNFGSCVNVLAPSYNIFGARPISPASTSTGARIGYEGDYSGTSLAAPLVAGVGALLKSAHPLWQADEIKARLIASALPIEDMQFAAFKGKLGRGRLDAATALADISTDVSVYGLNATVSGRPTRVTVANGKDRLEFAPFGTSDTRGARVAFTDTDGDGAPEIMVVPATGRDLVWILFGLDGKERKRGSLAKDLRNGALIASVRGGVMIADASGGRAWGIRVDAGRVETTLFHPYGTVYRAGLDLLAVAGAAAFAPRGGGGHLIITDVNGHRLVSAFPFGKEARGRWSLARLPVVSNRPESLVLSGPVGNRFLDASKLGPVGWSNISLKNLEASVPVVSTGRSTGSANVRQYDEWPR
ncbi:MAG TPA: S8 family serine peptidase [Candidatus Methylomirabilis sp.]|nr:S8 family serine peptidase [Candidatus Methylomirabilis sp.]